jgi:hypothetical protein
MDVWVNSGKKTTKIRLLFPTYLSVRLSAFENTRTSEYIFMTFDDMQFFKGSLLHLIMVKI